jgi:hypothetical protein
MINMGSDENPIFSIFLWGKKQGFKFSTLKFERKMKKFSYYEGNLDRVS